MSSGTSAFKRVEITVEIFYDQPDQSISLVTDDGRMTDENGQRPGFRVTFNANPKSADYNPANFNRLARLLRAEGRPAPAEVPVKQRQLNRRSTVIAELTGEQVRPTGQPADTTLLGWAICPTCTAVVVNLAKHKGVSAAC
ncbi:hypothetical protein ACQEVB_40675 [Pseudonocardia sp. CA-107938]|uniref:hypothetical protein n=1 Tax=Pseudonocardia sp. CA-107938 TaxID=3240021 RepID=UPI003D91C220